MKFVKLLILVYFFNIWRRVNPNTVYQMYFFLIVDFLI